MLRSKRRGFVMIDLMVFGILGTFKNVKEKKAKRFRERSGERNTKKWVNGRVRYSTKQQKPNSKKIDHSSCMF